MNGPADRPRPARGRWLTILSLTLLTIAALVVYFTPLFGVRAVAVSGVKALSKHKVVATSGVQLGTPLLLVDEAGIRKRVSQLSKVESVRVELEWPSTVRLSIVERAPVAYTTTSTGIQLVDDEGVPFMTVRAPPKDLVELRVAHVAPEDPATNAALTVLAALPDSVREQLIAIKAETADDVVLLLTNGRKVQWGRTRLTERKAAILPVLLTQPGTVYDVTSPALPTIS